MDPWFAYALGVAGPHGYVDGEVTVIEEHQGENTVQAEVVREGQPEEIPGEEAAARLWSRDS